MLLLKDTHRHLLSGILFVMLFSVCSSYIADIPWILKTGINSLVIAIVLGIIYSNTLHHRLPKELTSGIQFSAKQLLRLAIILYGFRVTFQQIASVGIEALILDVLVVGLTLILGTIVGTRVFKLDRQLSLLISSGSAICGAAAVLAVENVLQSEPYKASVAIGTVVLFGTSAMFLYPFLQHLGVFGFSDSQFGVFTGASIHEVAQALVAGNDVSPHAGNVAIIVKMTRVLLLVPVLTIMSFTERRFLPQAKQQKITSSIPWFAILFVAVIGFNSLNILPHATVDLINRLDIFLLTMAMAAIGMETNLSKIKNVGLTPLYLASALFLWLIVSVYCVVKFI